MRVLGLRADGPLFRGLITVKTQTGSANTVSITWSPVTEAEDGSISGMAS